MLSGSRCGRGCMPANTTLNRAAMTPEHLTAPPVDVSAAPNKWFVETTDVRMDQAINQQILELIEQHHVQRVAIVDRLIGWSHEEGIDYPEGAICPQCPYWAQRDRWTGELTA